MVKSTDVIGPQSTAEPRPAKADDRPHHRHLRDEVRHLREVADKGESGATPVILTAGILLIVIPIVALMSGLVLAIYYLA